MKVCVTGGTGFIGNALVDNFARDGHSVVVFTRKVPRIVGQTAVNFVEWDGRTGGAWEKDIDGADAVVNLAGESIGAGRWSKAQKERLVASRIDATRAIVDAIRRGSHKPSVLVNGSAVGYYGPVESDDVTEEYRAGTDFLAQLTRSWEHEALRALESGVRVVTLRTGVVLGKNGGALSRMIPPFRFFVGGPIGSGKQWFPWIHIDDVVGGIGHVIATSTIHGPVNTVAPQQVTNREFSSALGSVLGRPSWAPVPAPVLALVLGEMSDMLLTGQKVVPKILLQTGYRFAYPALRDALVHSISI